MFSSSLVSRTFASVVTGGISTRKPSGYSMPPGLHKCFDVCNVLYITMYCVRPKINILSLSLSPKTFLCLFFILFVHKNVRKFLSPANMQAKISFMTNK